MTCSGYPGLRQYLESQQTPGTRARTCGWCSESSGGARIIGSSGTRLGRVKEVARDDV